MKRTMVASVVAGILGATFALAWPREFLPTASAEKPLAVPTLGKSYTPTFSEWAELWLKVWGELYSGTSKGPALNAGIGDDRHAPRVSFWYRKPYERTPVSKTNWGLLLAMADELKRTVNAWNARGYAVSLDRFEFFVNDVRVRDFAAFRAFIQREVRKHL